MHSFFSLTLQQVHCTQVLQWWPHWQEYVAFHKQSRELVGPGIVNVTAQAIEGTKDRNRGGEPRVDLVLHHQDGGYVRLHPGSRPRLDAKPRYYLGIATEHAPAPHAQWLSLPLNGVFTRAHGQIVPQTDRISKADAWAMLQTLVLPRDRDLTDGTKFRWWLWIANIAPRVAVIGAGIRMAELVTRNERSAVIEFTRVDQSVVRVQLAANRSGLSVRHATQQAPGQWSPWQ